MYIQNMVQFCKLIALTILAFTTPSLAYAEAVVEAKEASSAGPQKNEKKEGALADSALENPAKEEGAQDPKKTQGPKLLKSSQEDQTSSSRPSLDPTKSSLSQQDPPNTSSDSNSSIPESTTPKTSDSNSSIPESTTPKTSDSNSSIPESTTPKTSDSNSSVPESTTPKADDTSSLDFKGAAPDIEEILNRGILRIGMCTIDQPPFHVKGRNGEFVGFDVELSRNIAAALGVQIQVVEEADWDKLVELIIENKIDLILSNLSLTPTRSAKICCSIPYAKIRQCLLINRVLLARAGSRGLITLQQVFSEYPQRNLLIQEGTGYVTAASGMFPKAQIQTTESWNEIMDRLLDREVFGTISDEIEIKKRMRSVQAMELMPVVLKGKFDLMVIGISRKSPQLLHFINSYIESNNVECNVEDF